MRVIAGDPDRSFLYQKIAGDPQLHNIPAIGARMPQGAPRMAQADIDLINAWIKQGAQNAQGKTAGPAVPTPGVAVASPVGSEPPGPTGTSTIKGVVEDERHRPLPGAIVSLLLRGQDQPDPKSRHSITSFVRSCAAAALSPSGSASSSTLRAPTLASAPTPFWRPASRSRPRDSSGSRSSSRIRIRLPLSSSCAQEMVSHGRRARTHARA
ncbi:MAG: hypothetical protein ABI948_12055 [Thermoleophilia bacterium]